jgi:hypothetical protein
MEKSVVKRLFGLLLAAVVIFYLLRADRRPVLPVHEPLTVDQHPVPPVHEPPTMDELNDLRDAIRAGNPQNRPPEQFKMEVKGFHLVEGSTPVRLVRLRTDMAPGVNASTIGIKEPILFRYWQWFCLSHALEDTPLASKLKFDIIVGCVRFQKTQGLILLVGEHPRADAHFGQFGVARQSCLW